MNVSIGGIAKTVEITSFDKLGDVKVCMLTTTADGSVGFEQLSDEVRETIYASFPVDNAKGSIASFEDGADNVPVRELNLDLVPYQNLNGYANPWVGGAGKNFFDGSSVSTTNTSNWGIAWDPVTNALTVTHKTSYSTGVPIATINIAPATYVVSFASQTKVGSVSLYVNGTYSQTLSNGTTFTATSGNTYAVCINADEGTPNVISKLQIEQGSTATAYEPYENICPIYPNNGKNLLENTATSQTVNGITFTVNADGTVTANGTATAEAKLNIPVDTSTLYGDYYYLGLRGLSTDVDANAYMWDATASSRCKQWDGTTAAGNSFNGNFIQIKLVQGHTTNLILRVSNGKTVNNLVYEPMICPKETIDTSYVPYNAIELTRTGKNLADLTLFASAGWTRFIKNPVVSGGTVAFSVSKQVGVGTTYGFSIYATNSLTSTTDGVQLVTLQFGNTQLTTSATVPSGYEYLRIGFRASGGNLNDLKGAAFQIELGSSATEYEPYTADRYYIDSSTPIYGGTLEVETGVLTVDKKIVVFDGTNIGFAMASTTSAFYSDGHATDGVVGEVLSNQYPYGRVINGVAASVPYPYTVCVQALNGVRFAIYNPTYITASDFNAYLNTNPLQVIYPLATPQTYQLTPTQVKTLLGYNNIWTDSGTVEVQYRANIGLYIQKIIGSSEDDMIANQNIAANQYFFVGEELYYSTSAISAGQTIIVGTNCIKTTLADALNALNS